METIYFSDIEFKDRKSFISGDKIKMVPLEVKIDFKDLEKIVKERVKILEESKKEASEYIKSFRDLKDTIYVWNLPMSQKYYEEKFSKIGDSLYYLKDFLNRKNFGYSEPEVVTFEPPSKPSMSKKDYLHSFYSEFKSTFLENISIPNFILGVDKLVVSGLRSS